MRGVSSIFVILAVCSVVSGGGLLRESAEKNEASRVSYGELANAATVSFETMAAELAKINASTEPAEASDLRKIITEFRDYWDLFVFAYPYEGDETSDMWLTIGQSLDQGHHDVGEFKDLADAKVPYTEDDRVKLLAPVLTWKTAFEADFGKFYTYVSHPFKTTMFNRKFKNLRKKVFWGLIRERPKLIYTGLENLALLVKSCLQASAADWAEVKTLKAADLLTHDFVAHDFRKSIRATVSTANYFPDIFKDPTSKDLVDLGFLAYKRLGKVLDKVVQWRWYIKHSKPLAAAKAGQQAKQLWRELIDWDAEVDIATTLTSLSTKLLV